MAMDEVSTFIITNLYNQEFLIFNFFLGFSSLKSHITSSRVLL